MVTIKGSDLYGGFAKSFNKLSQIDSLPVNLKLNLVKLRKSLAVDAESMNEVMTSLDGEEEKKKKYDELLKSTSEYDFDPVSVHLVASKLSPEDIFNLQPILKEV